MIAAHEREIARHRRLRLVGVAAFVAFTLVIAYVAGPPEGFVTIGGVAVLLAYGALTEPKTRGRMFAPGLVQANVSRAVAEIEAVTIVKEPFSGDEAPPNADSEGIDTSEDRNGVEQPPSHRG